MSRPFLRPSPLLLAAALACAAMPSGLFAQRYIMKNGTALPAANVTLGSGVLVEQIANGERRYPFGDIARLEFPEPESFDEVEALIRAGKGPEALAIVEPVYRQFAPFSRIRGSHWPRAAELRLQALLLGEDNLPISAAAREIMQAKLSPEITGTAKLALAQIDVRDGKETLAIIMIDEIVREAPAPVQARAWLLRGELAAARSSHVEALEAYLRIPAFYGTFDELLPPALLGAARAYKGYGDTDRAERAALELIDTFPDTIQAASAKQEFGL